MMEYALDPEIQRDRELSSLIEALRPVVAEVLGRLAGSILVNFQPEPRGDRRAVKVTLTDGTRPEVVGKVFPVEVLRDRKEFRSQLRDLWSDLLSANVWGTVTEWQTWVQSHEATR